MNEQARWRTKAKIALENYFRKHSFPRIALGLLFVLTGVIGFAISYELLRLGLNSMGMRYPLAVMGAYGGFLLLLRVWVKIERARFNIREFETQAALHR